jgi:tetratricopeptide (TPR) repeat protein
MKIISLLVFFCTCFLASPYAGSQKPLSFRDTTIAGPQTFAFIVGISKYKYVRPLTYADKDALLFRDFLKSPGGGRLHDNNIFMLLNEDVNNANFWSKGFQWLKAKDLRRGDRLFIYLAGHGDAIDEDQFFFLGYDCNPGSDKNNYLVGGAIQLFNLKKKIANETTKGVEVFFIMDACRSNELPGGLPGLNFLNSAITEKKAGEIMMLATGAGQESLEDAAIGSGHGLFTYFLVDGMMGMADSEKEPDHKISFEEIQEYVSRKVPSIAEQRFKRKQEPFFCCPEKNNEILSYVDTAYLKNWLKNRSEPRLPGNSFSGTLKSKTFHPAPADTAMQDLYSRFYSALKKNKLTGNNSAEFYYAAMNRISARSPYTLDARSTLEVEYINHAQSLVNKYLDCGEFSKKQKQENFEAGVNLEKAIELVKHDEPEFAAALMGRMHFLKASGDYEKKDLPKAFQHAFEAFALDPDAAYINNLLALLHMENKNADSALHYAQRAVKAAPNWACAFTTLALAEKTVKNKKTDRHGKQEGFKKASFGFTAGGGLSRSNPTYSGNANTGIIGTNAGSSASGNLGLIYQVSIGNTISIRPTSTIGFENTEIIFQRRNPAGGEIFTETMLIKSASVNLGLPLIIRLSQGKMIPYFVLGPSFRYLFSQNSATSEQLPLNKSLFSGDGGFGVDIGLKSGFVISPELKYSAILSELRNDANSTPYTATLSSLKRNDFTLQVSLRKK